MKKKENTPKERHYIEIEGSDDNELSFDDITEDLLVIKINQLYSPDMSALELYEATRGIWKRRIKSVKAADYCLAVCKGIVVEVYSIDGWYPAGTTEYKTRVLNKERCVGRIEFVGDVAPDRIRNDYIGKSVKKLFKPGEASPVRLFKAYSGSTD